MKAMPWVEKLPKQLCRPIGWIKVLLMNILLILPNYLTTFVASNDV